MGDTPKPPAGGILRFFLRGNKKHQLRRCGWYSVRTNCGLAYWLVERAEASGANVGLHLLPVKDDGLLVSVSLPLAVGAPLGMAHVVPELYRFFAYITFAWHRIPFDQTVVLR